MTDLSTRPVRLIAPFAIANALVVSTLYWSHVTSKLISEEVYSTTLPVSSIPFAIFMGYAIGVGIIAFVPSAVTLISIRLHMVFLGVALLLFATAPALPLLFIASALIGIGASVAQRLLAAAAQLVGVKHAGRAIGSVIATALLGLIAVRLGGEVLAAVIGWREVQIVVAALILMGSLYDFGPAIQEQTVTARLPGAVKRSPLLWLAGSQQASFFAAYNAGWVVLLLNFGPEQRGLVIVGGGVTGLLAAMLSGRLSDHARQSHVVRTAAASMFIAATLVLPAAYAAGLGATRGVLLLTSGMMLLDAGLQAALVANQARVQGILPPARTRLAALLTICGALGGAIGAGTASWLWDSFGWQRALLVPAFASLIGLVCACVPLPGSLLFRLAEGTGNNALSGQILPPCSGQETTRAMNKPFYEEYSTMTRSGRPATNRQSIDAMSPKHSEIRYPELSVDDGGLVRLRQQTPLVEAETGNEKGLVHLGGQAPMFSPEIIADDGLVRLGGQSPIF